MRQPQVGGVYSRTPASTLNASRYREPLAELLEPQAPAEVGERPTSPSPWAPKRVTWTVDGEQLTADYNRAELRVMAILREQGATRVDLEALHTIKSLLDATIAAAAASPRFERTPGAVSTSRGRQEP